LIIQFLKYCIGVINKFEILPGFEMAHVNTYIFCSVGAFSWWFNSSKYQI